MTQELDIRSDLSENLLYDRPDFPVRTGESQLSFFDQYAAECHWHEDFEFFWVLDGACEYYVDHSRVTVEKGMGIFVNSGRLHFGYSARKEECRFRFIVIDPALLTGNVHILSDLIQPLKSGASFLLLDPKEENGRAILELLTSIFSLSREKKSGYELEILSEFSRLCARLFQTAGAVQEAESLRDQQAVKQMISYLNEQLSEKISLSDIARAGMVCESRCLKLFRLFTGQTPIRYLQQLRIGKSMKLLTGTEKNITDIAFECGFSGVSYFIETFRRLNGITPLQYRKRGSEQTTGS